jgi:glycosyltransferase involved in cell wall biosynthesis
MRGAQGSGRRVSFVVDSDAWGGAEVYVTHLARRAGGLGWRASVVCAEPVAGAFAAAAPDVDLAVVPLARHQPRAPQVEAALRAQRPDVVHVNLVDRASNAAAVQAALAVAPATATLHLDGPSEGSAADRRRLAMLYRGLGVVLTPARADRLVGALDLPPEHVVVVPNGVDVPATLPVRTTCGTLRLGALGRLTEQKGFDLLLASLRRLDLPPGGVQVVLGGQGRDEAKLRDLARGLPVDFPGFVADVPAFLRDIDLFCLPSRREAMPLALLEAMAHGLACIATDVGAVRDSVGEAAVVIPPGDVDALTAALDGLLRDGGRRAALGTRARARAVRDFDADLMARRTFAVLQRALRVPFGERAAV